MKVQGQVNSGTVHGGGTMMFRPTGTITVE